MSTPPSSDPQDVAAMRRQYSRPPLHEDTMLPNPFDQFTAWFREACDANILEPNAMSLATSTPDGRPLLRTVLLKNYDERGFVFYTNLESRKARHIRENPNASILFPWLILERQVIVCGKVEKLGMAEAFKYFSSRPRDSQIAAWASQQSQPISSRKFLEMEWECLKRKFASGQVPLPDFWGGFRVIPTTIEFWQGGPNRLHDRIQYTLESNSTWRMERLAP